MDLGEALREGIVAVDTNVLLLPYSTGPASLEQIRQTYEGLASKNRLRIPAQVAGEFAENRAEKLKTLFQQLSRKRSATVLAPSEYPLLEGIPEYAEMVKLEKGISAALSDYRKLTGELLNIVERWHWDDPVSRIYRALFTPATVVEPQLDREKLLGELRYRQEHRIPPGYMDSQNEHSGVGDLLIWKTLLTIGETEKQHLIFVSGDEKSDWRYQSEGRALYPRFELLDEYRRTSGGKSFLIVGFAELLRQFGVPSPVVEEVKHEEVVSSLGRTSGRTRAPSELGLQVEQAVMSWLTVRYPSAQVEWGRHRPPDIVLKLANGVEGYEVNYVSDARNVVPRIKKTAIMIKGFSAPEQMPIKIVVVVPHYIWKDVSARLRSLQPDIKRVFYVGPEVVVGILNENGQFEDRYKFGSGELPPN